MIFQYKNKNYEVAINPNGEIEKFENVIVNKEAFTSIRHSTWSILLEDEKGKKTTIASKSFIQESQIELDNGLKITGTLRAADAELLITLLYEFCEIGLAFSLDVRNLTKAKVYTVLDIVLSDAQVTGRMTLPVGGSNLAMGEADFIDEDDFKMNVNAYPIFINRTSFCGIEWPVASNSFEGEHMTCKLFLKKSLRGGESLGQSKRMFFGAAGENGAPEAFNERLFAIRGRCVNRKSMYFTWLTHGWEGMTVQQTNDLIDYMVFLNNEQNIHFDVLLFDAGIIESLQTYYDVWRLNRPELFANMTAFAERLKEINTQIGIWLGPDGYGRTEQEAIQRREALKWMVSAWNVGMIKLDVAVSYPLCDDKYYNNWYMEQLAETMRQLREIRPDLVVINHRITESPYILSILDSTLWTGMETYPDVYLMNYTRERPYSRMGTFERGMPNYCGSYNQLQEDHGVCFNGHTIGWKEDLLVQAFGRALAVSPEIYGMLYSLPDDEYNYLTTIMSMAEKYSDLLQHTQYMNGDFVHSDGKQTLICLINDDKLPTCKKISFSTRRTIESHILFASKRGHINFDKSARGNNVLCLEMRPFEVVLLLANGPVHEIDNLETKCEREQRYIDMELACSKPTEQDITICEHLRFAISSDPLEVQELRALPNSNYKQVAKCRKNSIEKIKEFNVVAENAWDNKSDTAWADPMLYDKLDTIWRVNFNKSSQVKTVEIALSETWPGPIIDEGTGKRDFDDSDISIALSGDGETWSTTKAELFREISVQRFRPTRIVADFPEVVRAKYMKLLINGISVKDICLRNARGQRVKSDNWLGNNMMTNRLPLAVFEGTYEVRVETFAHDFTIYVKLKNGKTAPLTQEMALAWLEPMSGMFDSVLRPEVASPSYPFHGWENNTMNEGNAWSYTFRKVPRGQYRVKLAYFGPVYHPSFEGELDPFSADDIEVGVFVG